MADNPKDREPETLASLSRGTKTGTDFVATVIASGVVGWGIDYLLKTTPWITLVMIFAGFALGIRNVWRATDRKRMGE
jgi:ATP synthase protein I